MRDVRSGVPQGSLLRPVFSILYVNDLVNSLNGIETDDFADDSSFVVIAKGPALLQAYLQRYLEKWLHGSKKCHAYPR